MSQISRRSFVKTTAATSAVACAAASPSVGQEATATVDKPNEFRSEWHRVPDRYWTGPRTWANPWEDWQIQQGKLVCTKKGKGRRNVHCLTHQLSEASAEAEIAVTIQYCGEFAAETAKELVERIGKNPKAAVKGSAGFELGIRVNDPLDDYRSRLLFGSGMPVGMNGQGDLVIGHSPRINSPALAAALAAGKPIRLVCKIRPDTRPGKMQIELSAFDASHRTSPAPLAEMKQAGIPTDALVGNVAVINNLPENVAGTTSAGLFAFSDWTMRGPKIVAAPQQSFGPVLWTLYTLSNRVMKLTAQMPPLGEDDEQNVQLQVKSGGDWKDVATAAVDPLACTATFRVADWDDSVDTPYRVVWTQRYLDGKHDEHTYDGTIRKDPKDKPEIVVAGYCCFTDYLFPNAAIAAETQKIDPDLMFFMGDQIYEGVGGFGIIREGDLKRMTVNYLRKVALVGWSFREVSKDRPTVWMPDDHDVYQGNVWGAGGRKITIEEWNSRTDYQGAMCVGARGGYVQPAEFVKAVERTQTAHLPDPFDPTPVKQGIGVYYTAMNYGRISFAILEDRKFKSGPLSVFHHKSHRPDWITDRAAARAADVPEAELLGERQLSFLRHWIADWHGVDAKMAVSQTIFCNAATHHGGPSHFLVADMDSNGWPQSGRNAALDLLRRGHAFMLGGDQHLPTLIQHGIGRHHDAGVSFCVPAGATGYQRWWRPEEIDAMQRDGARHDDRPNTGKYLDGFGNLIDMVALANPPEKRTSKNRLELGRQKSAGFGVVRINKPSGIYLAECWPVDADTTGPDASEAQYPGWPVAVTIDECAGSANPTLPPVVLNSADQDVLPVVQVLDAAGEVVTMVRMTGPRLAPRVFDAEGKYTVNVLLPGTAGEDDRVLKTFKSVQPGQPGELVVE